MGSKVRAVVFDADGTLFNTAELIYAAYEHIARTHGHTIPTPEAVSTKLGLPLLEIMEQLFPGTNHEHNLATNNEFFTSHYAQVAAYEGMEDVLEALRLKGIKLAILTNGDHKIIGQVAHHNINDYFSSIVHTGRVTQGKPDPEGFYLATKECGTAPEDAIMVGDMPPDILVGKNGHALATVGITHGFAERTVIEAAGADYIIDSLHELVPLIDAIES